MKHIFWLAIVIIGSSFTARGQIVTGGIRNNMPDNKAQDSITRVRVANLYEKKLFIDGKDTLPYRILLPELYDSSKQYPMLLFLHGAGERGRDNEKQLVHGASLFVKDDNLRKFHAIVVFPQCPQESYWSNVIKGVDSTGKKRTFEFQADGEPTKAMEMAIKLERKLLDEFPVNKEKVYVMGLSMGGMGTYEIVRRMPNTFAGAVAICGGADTSTARQIKKTAFWIFHGGKDDVVPPKYSEDMAMAIQKFYNAAEMQYTVYPDANHNSWDKAFSEPELLSWLFSQSRMK